MIATLYGEADSEKALGLDPNQRTTYAKARFQERMLARREFSANYISYLIHTSIIALWCCFRRCCGRSAHCSRRIKKYRKFQVALSRLGYERDIQHMLELNRVSRLIHKATFSARQRQAVNYSRKFVITDKSLFNSAKTVENARSEKATDDTAQIEKMI